MQLLHGAVCKSILQQLLPYICNSNNYVIAESCVFSLKWSHCVIVKALPRVCMKNTAQGECLVVNTA